MSFLSWVLTAVQNVTYNLWILFNVFIQAAVRYFKLF